MWRYGDIRQLPDVVRYWGKKRPDKVALIDGPVRRTYAELDRRSNALAQRLRKSGITPGAPVGFVGRNSVEFFELWFAATKIGSPIAPFNYRCPVEEQAKVVEDAGAPVIFVSLEFGEVMRAVNARVKKPFELVEFDPGGDRLTTWMGDDTSDPALPLSGLSPALLTYTSGTTGQPKGALYNQEAFEHSFMMASLEPSMKWLDDDVMLMVMPNFHLGGSWVCVAALYHGARLSIVPNFDTDLVLDAVPRDAVTLIPLVPTAIQLLLNSPRFSAKDFATVRTIQYFGSPITVETMKQATEMFRCELFQFYGATEMWIATKLSADEIRANESRVKSCGKPLPFVEMKIVAPDGSEITDGSVGEVVVRTPARFAGYLGQPEATARVMNDGFYSTGDLGRRDADGFYYLVDRAKDMVITGGENVYSVEVEAALAQHPAVAMAAIIGVPDATWGEKVTAYVVLAPGKAATEAELQQHCHERIARYKAPKEIHFETALPMTPSGKIQKAVLRERARKNA